MKRRSVSFVNMRHGRIRISAPGSSFLEIRWLWWYNTSARYRTLFTVRAADFMRIRMRRRYETYEVRGVAAVLILPRFIPRGTAPCSHCPAWYITIVHTMTGAFAWFAKNEYELLQVGLLNSMEQLPGFHWILFFEVFSIISRGNQSSIKIWRRIAGTLHEDQ
jgi:hypothetical protein